MPERKLTRDDLRQAAETYKNWGRWGPAAADRRARGPSEEPGLTETADYVRAGIAKRAKVVKDTGAKPD